MVKLDRRWCHDGARREAARRADGKAKESGRKQRARCERTGAEETLARVCELPSLKEHAGTVAEEARTRSIKHGNVSARHWCCLRKSSAQLRVEATQAATRADLLDLFAVRDPLRLMVDLCTGGRQLVRWSSSSLASEMRRILQVRPRR